MENKRSIMIIVLFSFILLLSASALACGERDVELVNKVENYETTTQHSACTKVNVEVNEEDTVLVEKNRIQISQNTAELILRDYLDIKYNGNVILEDDDHSDVKGHEEHNHAGGRLQDSHGTISYAFLIRGDKDFYEGKSIPLYVDAENGDVYGVGCGFGAGDVVFSPDIDQYETVLMKISRWAKNTFLR